MNEPNPTVADWQPFETCPNGVMVLVRTATGLLGVFSDPKSTMWTHWAPAPAPPAPDPGRTRTGIR